jgi:hypothetical protein
MENSHNRTDIIIGRELVKYINDRVSRGLHEDDAAMLFLNSKDYGHDLGGKE